MGDLQVTRRCPRCGYQPMIEKVVKIPEPVPDFSLVIHRNPRTKRVLVCPRCGRRRGA